VLITHRDRLTRFGFEYIEYFFNRFGVRIEIAMGEEESPREELVEDFIEIVTSFTARIYGKRSHKAKKLLEAVMNELEGD
ncbi:MAG: IS607 family transposase, partial [Euryarchaeota archaeon]|nr:IS607 family transposase [Euryarchaeota archaeon]